MNKQNKVSGYAMDKGIYQTLWEKSLFELVGGDIKDTNEGI